MTGRRMKLMALAAGLALVIFGGLIAYAIVHQIASGDQPLPTSIAVPPAEPPREVKDVLTNNDGDLIITYTDGSTQNAGRVVGAAGEGQAPTQAQISAALIEYCADGRCDSKAPTPQQILEAISTYCSGGICKGQAGADAAPITADQILAAVSTYCADGRCKGADGQSIRGDQGVPGPSTVMACVTRSLNGGTARYVAWKYQAEPDSAYRNLYKLPVWAECESPINLTEGGA